MLKIENTEVMGWEHAIRGMRNPKNSWEKSDSNWRYIAPAQRENHILASYSDDSEFWIGPNDADCDWIESLPYSELITGKGNSAPENSYCSGRR